jgi:hypothetical protein
MDVLRLLNTPSSRIILEIPETPLTPRPQQLSSSPIVASQESSSSLESYASDSTILEPSKRALKTSRDTRIAIQAALTFNIPFKEITTKLNVSYNQIR